MTKIDDLKRNISLIVLYEKETGNRLKASSGKLTGLCPFHSDSKVGNFFIYEDTNSFNCFACGFGGSNIDFIQRLHKLSFVDAVNYLSGERTKIFDLYKQPIKDPIAKSTILTSKDLEIYKFFFNCLELTEKGKKYLLGRGICEQTLNKYRILALDNPQTVFKRLKSEFSINDILSSGLGGMSVKNKPYFTFFLPAVIFTIFEDDQPVYFSSRNLTIEKSNRFFKLHKKTQKDFCGDLACNEVWVFEGWLDGLSYYELTGLENFIILSGLSKNKITELKNSYPKTKFILATDNDVAGQALTDISSSLLWTDLQKKFGLKQNYKDLNDILKILAVKNDNRVVINEVIGSLSTSKREIFEERCGIMEFSGNIDRQIAEKNALLWVLGEL